MGIGLQGAYGVAGANDALQQLLAQRVAERMYQDKLRQQDVENQRAQSRDALQARQLDQNEQFRRDQLTAQNEDRQQNRAHQLVSELSPNQSIDEPTAGVLRTTGRGSLITANPRPAGEGFVLPGSRTTTARNGHSMRMNGNAGPIWNYGRKPKSHASGTNARWRTNRPAVA